MSFPRVYAGRRRRLVWQLVASGLAQGGATLASAHFLRTALTGDGVAALAALAASGASIAALRVNAAGIGERLGQDYVTRVRLRIFEALAARPARAEQEARAGVAMARVISDLGSLRAWVSAGLARSAVAAFTLTAVLAGLAWAQPPAAALLGAIALGCGLGAAALAPLLRGYVREARRRRGRLANNLGEKLLAASTVRQLGRVREELRRVRTHSGWLRDALVRRARLSEALRALPDLMTPLALAGWLALGAERAAHDLAAGLLLLGVIGAALRDLTRALEHRLAFEEGRRRIAELLDAPRLAEPRRPEALPLGAPLALEIEGVSVGGALRDVSLAAKPGERVLVSGAAGAGKSTLLALVARRLDPDAGEVRLAGTPLRTLALDAVHDAVQLVSPELALLRGSVSENVAYGADDEDPGWLEEVAVACGLLGDPALPEGLATRVEERGANLSPGVRARIALARALALRPGVLLVDDVSFAVDAEAARALRRACELHPATLLAVAAAGDALGFDREWRVEGGAVREVPR